MALMPVLPFMPSSTHSSGPRCAIYTRQSRTRPGAAVSSCEAQGKICADFANGHGLALADEQFDDAGETSESLDRPALKRLLKKVEQGEIDHVVVYSIDRLTRKLRDLSRLLDVFERNGVKLSVVTDPNFGASAAHRLTSNIVAAASEFQFDLTRERMADARAALKRQGRRVAGRVPFGYRADRSTKQLVADLAEAAIVRQVFELAAAGSRPQEIADRFNREKNIGARGQTGSWTARQILKLLSNPIYTGAIHDGPGTLPGRHEAIVTPAVFEQVRESIEARRSREPGRTAPKVNWLLRGILKCGVCGRVMSPSISGYRNFRYRYYRYRYYRYRYYRYRYYRYRYYRYRYYRYRYYRYRYYRCRSRAFGRPPCKDVGVSAYKIEEFVRATLSSEAWELADPTAAESQEFSAAWHRIDERQQMAALPDILKEVRFDPRGGTIAVTLVEHALDRLRGR
jgi:DNA invertase Pin-like site-specific DNA recombinase